MDMITWNKQTSTILSRKPVAGKSSEKLQSTKLNCRDFFYFIKISSAVLVVCMLLKFRLFRFPDIVLRPCLVRPKRGNLEFYIVHIYIYARLSRCRSFGIASVLQQLRATSSCCIVSFSFIGGTSVVEFLQRRL